MTAGLREYRADLHIHTALSPCAEREMTPPAIVEAALRRELSMIAICDHNSAGNTEAVEQAAGGRLTVLHGLEVTTAEEVHVLGLFADAASAQEVGRQVHASLPLCRPADERHFGQQWLMDYRGKVLGKEKSLLAAKCDFDLSRVVKLITDCGGLAVASHVDRPSFSVLSQLGFVPADVTFDALELSPQALRHGKGLPKAAPQNLPIFVSSDSHFLSEVGSAGTVLRMQSPCFDELRLAVKAMRGRGVMSRYCA